MMEFQPALPGYALHRLPGMPGQPMVADIQRIVADYFTIPLATMTSPSRIREYARPRQLAMYLVKVLTTRSLPEIGRMFGGRDHTTVIHAIRQIEKLSRENPDLRQHLMNLLAELGG